MSVICRLCLEQNEEKKLFLIWDEKGNDLLNKIQECTSITLMQNKLLPSMVCICCIEHMNNWVAFKQKCVRSNDYLLNTIRINKIDSIEEEEEIENDVNELNSIENCNIFEEVISNCNKLDVSNNIYSCEICHQEFNTCFDYLNHQDKHNGESVFKCNKCTEIFSNRNDLVLHEKNHKSPCPHCGKMILKSSLKLHLIKHTDKHKCPHCSNRFNSRASLDQHIITVHTNIKNHICESCGKRFSSQSSMKVHLRTHSEERMYPCKLCNYAGRTASAIYIHMSTHANDLCVCEVCSKTFKSTRNLNDHLRRVHSKNKKHECVHCKKKFVDKYMLSVHLRCHTGVRPYQCPICEKSFIRSDGLKEHMVTHGQRVIYDCKSCGKKFTSKRGVNRHNCIALL